MKKPFVLTLAKVKKAALKAHAAGKLTAQHPIMANRQCLYAVDDYRCVVGAALPAYLAKELARTPSRNRNNIAALSDRIPDQLVDRDMNMVSMLQGAHDTWATAAAGGHDDADVREAHLLELLRS